MSDKKIKIFVADALEVWRRILANIIETVPDMEVAGEINSAQGVMLMLEEVDPDLVMLDVNVCDRIELPDLVSQLITIKPEVRIILCADRTRKEKVVAGVAQGVYDFVIKPYEAHVVLRAIRECMSSRVSA